MVLGGLVNTEIVSLLNKKGKAVGVTGKDGNLIRAKKLRLKSRNANQDVVDIGQVGEVVEINTEVLEVIKASDFIPVIAPIGADERVRATTSTPILSPARSPGSLVPKN